MKRTYRSELEAGYDGRRASAEGDLAAPGSARLANQADVIYRDGELYALDPHDAELDLWAFRLGLRPPRVQRTEAPPPRPRPPANQRLSVEELDAAWRNDANLDGCDGAHPRGAYSTERQAGVAPVGI